VVIFDRKGRSPSIGTGGHHAPVRAILEVDSRTKGEFTQYDISFLQGAANILGMAIERQRHERRLQEALEGGAGKVIESNETFAVARR
jgi:hypothetical protein